ncbi:hypothetical protein MOUN0_N05644 [Monosporozyma unispora]|nr:hypothetical protein C6P44_003382 [Kazachstania unispora]
MLNLYKTLNKTSPRFSRTFATGLIQRESIQQYKNESVKLIAIPINTKKTFVYFKHSDHLTNKKSKLIKWEQTIVQKCKNVWAKMEKSPKRINMKTVSLVNQYMNRIPWQENSLLSIPGENYIMKRIAQEEPNTLKTMTAKQYKRIDPPPKLVPISIYSPNNLKSNKLMTQLTELSQWGLKYHLREVYKCILLLPLTVPIILVPIVPNVPGFYLTYRIYCNMKAYLGAKHLHRIIKDDMCTFKQNDEYDKIISEGALTSDKIDQITELFGINEINSTLKRSLLQESKTKTTTTSSYN